jgi:hypothetical protein
MIVAFGHPAALAHDLQPVTTPRCSSALIRVVMMRAPLEASSPNAADGLTGE